MSTGGVAFHIGSQQAGAIYQAAGDQTIGHAGGTLALGALRAVDDLRTALESAPVPAAAKHEVEHALEAVESELGAPEPDRGRIARRLERIIGILGKAGALASTGESLLSPLRSIASFAGAAGATALRLLA